MPLSAGGEESELQSMENPSAQNSYYLGMGLEGLTPGPPLLQGMWYSKLSQSSGMLRGGSTGPWGWEVSSQP